MTRLLSISSSRADVGILQPVWRAAAPDCELHILLTGMHCAATAGDIDAPAAAMLHRGGADLAGADASQAAHAMAAVSPPPPIAWTRSTPTWCWWSVTGST